MRGVHTICESVTDTRARSWVIIIAVVVGLAVVAAIIVVSIILVKRRRNHDDRRSAYVPLRDNSYTPSPAPYTPAPATASLQAAPPQNVVMCRLVSDVAAKPAEHVIGVMAGEVVQITVDDFGGTSDWVWAKVGVREGYVPRLYCNRIN